MPKYSYLLLFFLFISCEQYFVPEIDKQDSHLVFEGLITTETKAHEVLISKSQPFNQDSLFTMIEGYSVWIEDEQGTLIPLYDSGNGVYVTDTLVSGEIGKAYRLVASDNKGNEYISAYDTILPATEISEVYGELATESKLRYTEYAGYEIITTGGLQIYLNTSKTEQSNYFRYEYDLLFQSTQKYPTSPWPIVYYILQPSNSIKRNFFNLVNGNEYAHDEIKGLKFEFIGQEEMDDKVTVPEVEFTPDGKIIFDDDDIYLRPKGFFIRVKQLSISKPSYEFWKAVSDQLSTKGQLLDPVKSQVSSNISCTNNPTKKVYGHFDASAVSTSIKFFQIKKINGSYIVKSATPDTFPEIDTNSYSKFVYPFWISL